MTSSAAYNRPPQPDLSALAPAAHNHDAAALTSGTIALARLPVAASGVSSAQQLVRADDCRLDGAAGLRNAVINGCCRVSHRGARPLSDSWQYAAVDLLAVRADGAPAAGTITQAGGLGGLTRSGYACLVQGATLGSGGAVCWRHRIEAGDAVRLGHGPLLLSARTWHDTGAAVTYTLSLNRANLADDFSAVTELARGTLSIASDTNSDLLLALDDAGDCSAGLELQLRAECGAVSGKSFYLGELQLEPGSVRTAFEHRPLALETRLVARFLRRCGGLVAKANSASNLQVVVAHPGLRAAPAYEVTAALAFTDAVTADFTQSQPSITTVHDRTADHGRVSCGFFSGLTSGTVLLQRGTGGLILAAAEL